MCCRTHARRVGEEATTPGELDLAGVSIQAKRGEVTAIVGAVGSGKTTLISAVVGDLLPISGKVCSSVSLFE